MLSVTGSVPLPVNKCGPKLAAEAKRLMQEGLRVPSKTRRSKRES
jgi:hypothetical protein